MFGAQPFTQKLLMFEEFGPEKLDPTSRPAPLPFPPPEAGRSAEPGPGQRCRSGPDSDRARHLPEAARHLARSRRVESNTDAAATPGNPRSRTVPGALPRPIRRPKAVRREKAGPTSAGTSSIPQAYYKTVQAGARTNGGFRDSQAAAQLQRRRVRPRRSLPQHRRHRPLPAVQRHHQGHPDPVPPEHAGAEPQVAVDLRRHLAAEAADGALRPAGPDAPLQRAADRPSGQPRLRAAHHHARTSTTATTRPRATASPTRSSSRASSTTTAGRCSSRATTPSTPRRPTRAPRSPARRRERCAVNDVHPGLRTCQNGSIKIRGDWRETMSTHWFHDHMLDFTAQNVYKGNAVMMNYYSALDRGNEAIDDGVNLRMPSGSRAALGQPRLRREPGDRRQGLGPARPALVQPLQHRRLPRRPADGQLAVQAVPRRARAPLSLPHPERLGVALPGARRWCSRSAEQPANCPARQAPASRTTGCRST